MAGGGQFRIKGGRAVKGQAIVDADGNLLVALAPGSSVGGRFQMNFYGEDPGSGVTTVELMEENTEIGIPLARAVRTGNVAVKFRRNAGAAPGDWTLRLFKNGVEAAIFLVGTT